MSRTGLHAVSDQPVLDIRSARITFGGLVAVNDVSFSAAPGQVLGLVGPNGAGKTTLFNAISGLVQLAGGEIHYDPGGAGKPTRLDRIAGWRRRRLGVGRTFQDSRLIPGLPVIDQLASGVLGSDPSQAAWLRLPAAVRRDRAVRERAHEITTLLSLRDREATDVDLLSAPERRLVDLGRALMGQPRLLLLDEIGAGMPPQDKERVVRVVQGLVERDGTTVVLVEHDMQFVRSLVDHVVAIAGGTVIAQGEPASVLRDKAVLEAYIGEKAARSIS